MVFFLFVKFVNVLIGMNVVFLIFDLIVISFCGLYSGVLSVLARFVFFYFFCYCFFFVCVGV